MSLRGGSLTTRRSRAMSFINRTDPAIAELKSRLKSLG
jgi:hypothetical protein